MRIAIIDNLPEGGAKRVVYEQIRFLAQANEIWYGTNNLPTQWAFEQLPIKYSQFELDCKRYRGIKRLAQEWELWWTLRQKYQRLLNELAQWQPEILIVHPCRYTQASWVLSLSKLKKIYFAQEWPRIVYEKANFPLPKTDVFRQGYESVRRRLIKKIDKRNVGASDKVVTTSKFNADHFKQAYSLDPEILPLGVDVTIFKPTVTKEAKRYFLFIGERDEIHGYPLLQAVEKEAGGRFSLRVINLSHQGFSLSDLELVRVYQGAAAVLCLDKQEPFGLIPLEAMACGVPVIAVNEGGYQETIKHEKTGLLVERTPLAIYGAMKQVAREPEWARHLGQAGRRRVINKYTWARHGQQLAALIKEMR